DVPLAESLVLRSELRDHGRDDCSIERVEAQPIQLQEMGDRASQLIGGGARHRAQAPVARELGALERPDVGLRVADVDREQHAGDYRAGARNAAGGSSHTLCMWERRSST